MRWMGRATPAQRMRIYNALSPTHRRALAFDWDWQAHPGQREPDGDWQGVAAAGGRGFGKTGTGAEWVLQKARDLPEGRIALVSGSLKAAARVMVEGESGILRCAAPDEKLEWRPSKGELRFASGALAQLFSGADGERLRGPQHHFAWAD